MHVAFNYYSYDAARDITDEAEQTAREIKSMEVRVHHDECDVRDSRDRCRASRLSA